MKATNVTDMSKNMIIIMYENGKFSYLPQWHNGSTECAIYESWEVKKAITKDTQFSDEWGNGDRFKELKAIRDKLREEA